jgi:hypothetical protein
MKNARNMKHSYAVTGSDRFPIDMLRYDQAEIASDHDANVAAMHETGMRSVFVRGACKPTVERWESFGWHVVKMPRK